MQEVSMFEAKTQLSKLVKLANLGEEVVITSGRDHTPVARIVAIEPKQAQRRPLGLYEGMFEVGPEFFEPLPEEELRLWNGEGD
jgi:antitoxin (DNA-binding transcriptional repressor) of toxin-antitoxin stability system